MNEKAEIGGPKRMGWGLPCTRHRRTILAHFILKANLRHKCESLHFTDDKTEALRRYSAPLPYQGKHGRWGVGGAKSRESSAAPP